MNPSLNKESYTSFDQESFPYSFWGNYDSPEIVIIAVHGINGAAQDYDGLGCYIEKKHKTTAIYAAETRGQGNDPRTNRRGDIYKPSEWYRDLDTFTQLVKKKHPQAKIIWCGESMGSLIVTHSYCSYKVEQPPPCDAILLLAPVIDISHKLPLWKYHLAQLIAKIIPRFRVSLNTLSGNETAKVTQGADNHDTQSATNSYHISKFTLRLLATLGEHIQSMRKHAALIHHPTLIINGGNDYFTPAQYVDAFCKVIPQQELLTHRYYPQAYHLLMYDDQREEIFSDIVSWLKNLNFSY